MLFDESAVIPLNDTIPATPAADSITAPVKPQVLSPSNGLGTSATLGYVVQEETALKAAAESLRLPNIDHSRWDIGYGTPSKFDAWITLVPSPFSPLCALASLRENLRRFASEYGWNHCLKPARLFPATANPVSHPVNPVKNFPTRKFSFNSLDTL